MEDAQILTAAGMKDGDAGLDRSDGKLNTVLSYALRADNPDDLIESKRCAIDRLILRRVSGNRYSIAVVTKDDGEVFVPSKLVSLHPAGIKKVNLRKIDLDTLARETVSSFPWPYRSTTNAVLEERPDGILVLRGRVEFMVWPSVDGQSEPAGNSQTRQIVDLGIMMVTPSGSLALPTYSFVRHDAARAAIVNFGDGARLAIGKLTKPVVLVNGDGGTKSVTSGAYQRKSGAWIATGR